MALHLLSKIWVLWKSSIHLSIFHSHDQVVTFAVHEEGRLTAYLSFVYAKCTLAERRELWRQLSLLSASITVPWMVGGDWNVILFANEKLAPEEDGRAIDEFDDALCAASLADAGFIGSRFTWCNKKEGPGCIRARLDRCLINSSWLMKWFLKKTSINHWRNSCSALLLLCSATLATTALFFPLWCLPYPFSRPIQINILIRQGYSGTSHLKEVISDIDSKLCLIFMSSHLLCPKAVTAPKSPSSTGSSRSQARALCWVGPIILFEHIYVFYAC